MKQSLKIKARLEVRVSDYFKMVAQRTIGDGHRDATGYKKPGGKTGGGKRVNSGKNGF